MITRVTAIVQEEGKLLLLEQKASNRSWSLPGGKVEENESLGEALVREMKEETGLDIEPGELLYLCDFITDDKHVLHITFSAKVIGGSTDDRDTTIDTNEIKSVEFIPIDELENYGFSDKFKKIVIENFPGKGSYMGAKSNIGL